MADRRTVRPLYRGIHALTLLYALLVAPPALAQQQLSNPQFNLDLSGWQQPLPAQSSWITEDIDGLPGSGSAQLVNSESAAASESILLTQCFPMPGTGHYRLRGSARILDAQLSSGSVVMRLTVRPSGLCSGGYVSSSGAFLSQSAVGWETAELNDDFNAQQLGATASGMVEIAVRKSEAGGMLIALVDQITLDFTPDMRIFVDGFE